MRSITGYLPWGLLVLSLGVIGTQAVESGSIEFGRDQQGFCQAQANAGDGTQVRLRVRSHHWIWVKCSPPNNT